MANSETVRQVMLELKKVTVAFGDNVVLREVTCQVYRHEVLVIIGPSGEGKSVLLKTMAGVIRPVTGQVLIEGEDWQSLESADKHKLARKIGMLFQRSALFDEWSVEENVKFPMREHLSLSESEMHERATGYLKAVGLGADGPKFPYELSGGMQKRLGIARALALNPEIVFYDDPMAGQDPLTADKIMTLILDLKKANSSTLVVVTNDMNQAFRMADRLIMVVNNTVIETGSPEETRRHTDPRVKQFIRGELQGPIRLKF